MTAPKSLPFLHLFLPFSTAVVVFILFPIGIASSAAPFSYPELANSLNSALSPCEDFYAFVCDGFEKQVKLRSECTEISNAATRKQLVQAQLLALLRQPPPVPPPSRITNLEQQMWAFHGACLSWPRNEIAGSEAVLAKLEWLTTTAGQQKGQQQQRRQFDTQWAIRAFPSGAFFQLVPAIDTRKGRGQPGRKIIGIRPKPLISSQAEWNSNKQGNSLLSTRFGQIMHALLEDDIWRALRQNRQPVLFPFTNYILQGEVSPDCLRLNCPMSDRLIRMLFAEAERRVRNLLLVEQRMASHFDTDPLFESGPVARQSYLRLSQLAGTFALNWTQLLAAILAPLGSTLIGPDTEVHIAEPGFVHRMSALVGQLSGQQIADYLDWQLLWSFLPQLDRRYTQPYVNVNKLKDSLGVRKCPLEKRWMQMGEKCEKFVEWYFPQLLDRLYIQRHMGAGVRPEIKEIYTNVYASFRQMLQNNSWLDFGAKQRSLAKLEAMQANAVYFDPIFDDNYLTSHYRPYQGLRLDVPFAQVVHQLEGLNFLRQMSTSDFYDPAWSVNAYYSRENNALVVLNGYLHAPIYSPHFPAPLNYAGIGTVLGHELSHGFDDWGSYHNAEGKVEDWLGPGARRAFHQRKQCFVRQYGGIWVPVDRASLPINGSLTANENIADHAGLAAAFHAWKRRQSTASSSSEGQQPILTGLAQFNGDQLFFIHYAFRQCSRMGQVWLRQRLLLGQHSVVPARVNIPLQNSAQFATAFNCPAGTPMNPTKKCALW